MLIGVVVVEGGRMVWNEEID